MRKIDDLSRVLVLSMLASCSVNKTTSELASSSANAANSNDVKIQALGVCSQMLITDKSSVEDITRTQALNFAAICDKAKSNSNFIDEAYENDCKSSETATGADTKGDYMKSDISTVFSGNGSYDHSKKSQHCSTKENYTAFAQSSVLSKCSETLSTQQLERIFSEQKSKLNTDLAKQANDCVFNVMRSQGSNLECRGSINGNDVALNVALLDTASVTRVPVKLIASPNVKFSERLKPFELSVGPGGTSFQGTTSPASDGIHITFTANVDTRGNNNKADSCTWQFNEWGSAVCDGTRRINLITGRVLSENAPICKQQPKPEPVVVKPEKPRPRFVVKPNGRGHLCSKPANGRPNQLCTISDCRTACNMPGCRVAELDEVRGLKGWGGGWDGHILMHNRNSRDNVCRVQGKRWEVNCGTGDDNVSGQACGCTCEQ